MDQLRLLLLLLAAVFGELQIIKSCGSSMDKLIISQERKKRE